MRSLVIFPGMLNKKVQCIYEVPCMYTDWHCPVKKVCLNGASE